MAQFNTRLFSLNIPATESVRVRTGEGSALIVACDGSVLENSGLQNSWQHFTNEARFSLRGWTDKTESYLVEVQLPVEDGRFESYGIVLREMSFRKIWGLAKFVEETPVGQVELEVSPVVEAALAK